MDLRRDKPIPLGAIAWCVDITCRAPLDDAAIAADGSVDCPGCGAHQVVEPRIRKALEERKRKQLGLFGGGVR